MENIKDLSIKKQLERSKSIDPSKIRRLRNYLLYTHKTPQFKISSDKLVYTGETVRFRINDSFAPLINIYEGKIEKGHGIDAKSLKVSLNGINGPLIAPCNWNKKLNEISFKVPQGAVHGVIFLLIPAEIYYGPSDDERIKKFLNSKECENEGTLKSSIGGNTIVIPEIICYLSTTCGKCQIPSLSICPNNAILFDDLGYCYVDNTICEGQYRIFDSSNNYTEYTCWKCFPQNSTSVSSDLCNYGNLHKVLSIAEGCCGCCAIPVQVIRGMCLMEFCTEDAITGGYPEQYFLPDGTAVTCVTCPNQVPLETGETRGYKVNPELCIGCMVCYSNILCRRPKMKAYIKGKKIAFRAQYIRLRPIHPEIPEVSELKLALGVWGELDGTQYFKEIKLNFGDDFTAPIDRHFESSKPVQFGIYGINKDNSKFTLSGDIRPAFQTVNTYRSPHIPRRLTFTTRFGKMQLDLVSD